MRPEPPASVVEFYDALAPWYHLVYRDWEAGIARQGDALAALLAAEWGDGVRRLLDVTMGVGTQALGVTRRHEVVALRFARTAQQIVEGHRIRQRLQ